MDLPEELSAIYDFVYLDQTRIETYYAQLITEGVLTSTKIARGTTGKSIDKGKVDIKVLGIEHGAEEGEEQRVERTYDSQRTLAIDALALLQEQGYISDDLATCPLGRLCVVRGSLQVLDIRLVRELWQPMLTTWLASQRAQLDSSLTGAIAEIDESAMSVQQKNLKRREMRDTVTRIKEQFSQQEKQLKPALELIAKLPHPLQMAVTSGSSLSVWATMQAESVVVNSDDFVLKHGTQIAGDWSVVGLIDARPDPLPDVPADESLAGVEVPQPVITGLGALADSMTFIGQMIRDAFGRPRTAFGITPIAVYRVVLPHDAIPKTPQSVESEGAEIRPEPGLAESKTKEPAKKKRRGNS